MVEGILYPGVKCPPPPQSTWMLSFLCYNKGNEKSLCINCVFYCRWPCAVAIKSFHRLIMGKWKLAFISVLLQIFWQKFYRNVPGVVLYKPYGFCPNHWFWLATKMLNFRKKYSKIFYSGVIRGMKLKLCINVCVIILYINYIFIAVARVVSLLRQLLSFHRFIMGKMKVGLYFYLNLDILTKALQ